MWELRQWPSNSPRIIPSPEPKHDAYMASSQQGMGLHLGMNPGLFFDCQSLDQQIGNNQEDYIGALGRNANHWHSIRSQMKPWRPKSFILLSLCFLIFCWSSHLLAFPTFGLYYPGIDPSLMLHSDQCIFADFHVHYFFGIC